MYWVWDFCSIKLSRWSQYGKKGSWGKYLLICSSAETLATDWQRESAGVLDRIMLMWPLSVYRSLLPMVYRGVEGAEKGQEIFKVLLEENNKLDQTWVKAPIKVYLVAVRVEKWQYFSIHIASTEFYPAALFRVNPASPWKGKPGGPSTGSCEGIFCALEG